MSWKSQVFVWYAWIPVGGFYDGVVRWIELEHHNVSWTCANAVWLRRVLALFRFEYAR